MLPLVPDDGVPHVLRLCSVFEPETGGRSGQRLDARAARFDPIGGMQNHTATLTRCLDAQGLRQTVVTSRLAARAGATRLGRSAVVHRTGPADRPAASAVGTRRAAARARPAVGPGRRRPRPPGRGPGRPAPGAAGRPPARLPAGGDAALQRGVHAARRLTADAAPAGGGRGGGAPHAAPGDAVVVLTEKTAAAVRADGVPAGRVHTIPSGFDPALFAGRSRGRARRRGPPADRLRRPAGAAEAPRRPGRGLRAHAGAGRAGGGRRRSGPGAGGAGGRGQPGARADHPARLRPARRRPRGAGGARRARAALGVRGDGVGAHRGDGRGPARGRQRRRRDPHRRPGRRHRAARAPRSTPRPSPRPSTGCWATASCGRGSRPAPGSGRASTHGRTWPSGWRRSTTGSAAACGRPSRHDRRRQPGRRPGARVRLARLPRRRLPAARAGVAAGADHRGLGGRGRRRRLAGPGSRGGRRARGRGPAGPAAALGAEPSGSARH